jgi:cholesterol oxidase
MDTCLEVLRISETLILQNRKHSEWNRPTTAHILGGCPMSETVESGVIDKNLKVHGYPDFYITDGSAIQGNIGVNPSFTITAAAEYCMSKIQRKPDSEIPEISKKLSVIEEVWKKKKLVS